MEEKPCSKCGVVKPFGEFHKQKDKKCGFSSHCRDCKKEHYKLVREDKLKYAAQYRTDNIEKISDYKKEYRRLNREKISDWHKENRKLNYEKISIQRRKHYNINSNRINDRNSKYQKTENGKANHDKATKKYNIKYPERIKAIRALNNAIRDDKVIKQPCEVCDKTRHIHGHHDDYNKPLDVRWLCSKHHKDLHCVLELRSQL